MKRFLSFILSVLMVLSVCVFSINTAARESNELYASVISFDNNDVSMIRSENATVVSVKKTVVPEYGIHDVDEYHVEISGEGFHSVNVDTSGINFYNRYIQYVVLDTDSDVSKLSVYPIDKNGWEGNAATFVSYNGFGYFKFNGYWNLSGIRISVTEEGMSYNLTEAFFCINEYSAKFIVDNNVLPSTATPSQLVITEKGSTLALDYEDVTEADMDVSRGGIYYDFSHSKWPSIVVDENDKVYVGASSCRRDHTDPFGATVISTSEDGGLTYTKPRVINNTICDDRDVGLTYMGNGKLLASWFTEKGDYYLPDREFYFRIRRNRSKDWQAASWKPVYDENNRVVDYDPVGGVLGTYVDLLQILCNDPDYDTEARSYVIKSTDYGETWNVEPYVLKDEDLQPYENADEIAEMCRNYQINYPSATPVPCSSPHGPVQLSDGSVIWVGTEDYNVNAYVSNDEGDTWSYKGNVPIPVQWGKGNFFEPDVTETKDGVLVCAVRSFEVFTSFSYDKGATWTTMYDTHATADGRPLEGVSHGIMTMPNGDIVLNVGRNDKYIYIYVSQDGGRTWTKHSQFSKTVSVDDDTGYPGSAVLSDGTIITVWYCNSGIVSIRWTYEVVNPDPDNWLKVENGWQYYDSDKNLVTNKWIEDATGWCYVGADGYLVTNASAKYNRQYRLVDANGHWVKKAGWNKAGDDWCYVKADGSLVTESWMKDSKGWCFLSSKGMMLKNRSVKDSKGYCLVDASGYWVTKPGWNKAGNTWYYVQSGGYLKTSGWMKDSKGWCFLAYDGTMETNKSVKDSKGYCLVDASGYWVTKQGWHLANGDWYYTLSGGYLKTNGWMKDSRGWCYLDNTGCMLTDVAVKDSKGWCLLDKDGYWVKKLDKPKYISASYDTGFAKGTYTINSEGYLELVPVE